MAGPIEDVSFRAHVAIAETMPVLRREEELQLARRYREHGDTACADRLVLCHLRAVIYMAYKYRGIEFGGGRVESNHLGSTGWCILRLWLARCFGLAAASAGEHCRATREPKTRNC